MLHQAMRDGSLEELVGKGKELGIGVFDNSKAIQIMQAEKGVYSDTVLEMIQKVSKDKIEAQMKDLAKENFSKNSSALGAKEKKKFEEVTEAKKQADFLQVMYETTEKIKELTEKTKGIDASKLKNLIGELGPKINSIYGFMFNFAGMVSSITSTGIDLTKMTEASETFTKFNESFDDFIPSMSNIISSVTTMPKINEKSMGKIVLLAENTMYQLSLFADAIVIGAFSNPALSTKMEIATTNLNEVAEALTALNAVTKKASALKSKDISAIVNIAKSVATVAESLSNANEMLSPDKVENVIPVLESLKNFKGGKIEMTHNMPNAVIKLNVNINSKKLGQSIVTTDLSNDTKKQLYPQLGNVDNKDLLKPA
jgi:hypothetical protein